jgi:hypothetical protein
VTRVRQEKIKRRERAARGESLRAWLNDRRELAKEAAKRQAKADLLTGETGGGSGVTVTMRRISGQAQAKQREWVYRQPKNAGPTRQERRHNPRYGRSRHTRQWIPPETDMFGRVTPGRFVWPTPPGRNVPYVRPRDTQAGDHA